MGEFSVEEAWGLCPSLVRGEPIVLRLRGQGSEASEEPSPPKPAPPAQEPEEPPAAARVDPDERARRWLKFLLRAKLADELSKIEEPAKELPPEPWELPDPPEAKEEDRKMAAFEAFLRRVETVPVPVYSGEGVGLLYDRRMARHRDLEDPTHPEQPLRIVRIFERLEEEGLAARCVRIPCRKALKEQLVPTHTLAHVDAMLAVENLPVAEAIQKGHQYNSVFMGPQTTQAALLSAGSVLEGVERVCAGDVASAACVVRPPGHHAERTCAMGFCMFANVAVAVAEARRRGWSQRTLIVDWDVHHGNGTQHIFQEDSSVLFFSVHRHDNGRFYPGGADGHFTSHGTGKGEGFCVNVPWDVKGARKKGLTAPGDAEYLEAFAKVLLPVAGDFSPDLVVVSAGFDSALGDPLGECRVSPGGFHELTRQLTSLAGGRLVIALEGGYNLDSISASMAACVRALLGDPAPDGYQTPEPGTCEAFHAETIEQVRSHLAQWWPSLRLPGDGPSGGEPAVRVPVTALQGSQLTMEIALLEHAEKTGQSIELLRQRHEVLVFKLEDVPKPLQSSVDSTARWETLRARLGRLGAESPPYLLPIVRVVSPEQAVMNATLAFRAGAHGVWLVNSGHAHEPADAAWTDSPPAPQRANLKSCSGLANKVGKAQLTALAECFAAVRRELPDWWIGLSVLQLPPAQVFKWIAAHCPGADGVWLEDLPGKPAEVSWEAQRAIRLEKWLEDSQPALKAVKRERQLVKSWSGLVFGSVASEKQDQAHHQQDCEDQAEACQALLRHWASLASSLCDVVVTASPKGGEEGAPSPKAKLHAMSGVGPLGLSEGSLSKMAVQECVSNVEVVLADAAFGRPREGGEALDFDQEELGQWVSRWRSAGGSLERAP